MTDEERQKLCKWLRDPSVSDIAEQCEKAANELERLAALVRKRPLTIAPRGRNKDD